MADFASLQFEMERRSILFTANTTMPDNSLLGFEGNPNSIASPSTPGETLIYNSPRGTNYLQLSNGTLWFKNASPNTWVAVADAQLSGYINNTFATITNLALTGQNLDNKINSLSGAAVLVYGDQTVGGLKNFTTRPTVSTVPVALSGEAASNIEQFVKNNYGFTLYKGQPVYVSGVNGNNILIHPASNSGEGTSSKTFGLLKQTLSGNEQGYVVTEGPLFNVDTSMATEGDPVWLGPTGNLIYGLANKPKAPQHLVSLGFVERAHENQGKIFVKVQNGFEIEELHDVRIVNKQNSDIIVYNSGSGLWLNSGVNFGSFATNSSLAATDSTLQQNINSLSGAAVLTYNNQTVNGIKYFNDAVYIHDLYVTGTEFIANVENNFIESPYVLLNLTGGAIDGGIFFVTGLSSGTSGTPLTGVNDYGPIIGFDHSDKFKFGIARRSDDLSTLNDIAAFQDITNYSGFVNTNFYSINNPNGYITNENVVFTTGDQTISGSKTFAASRYVFSGANAIFVDNTGIVSGAWQFNNRPTVNGTGVLLEGEAAQLPTTIVYTTGDQTIGGTKTFSNTIVGSIDGNAATVTDGVYTTGSQTISGSKTFESSEYVFSGANVSFLDGIVNFEATGYVFSGAPVSFIGERPTVNGTGVLLEGEAAQLPTTIVYTTGDQTISGSKTFAASRYVFSGANAIFVDNTGIVSGAWQFNNRPTVNGTGVLLEGEAAQLPDTIVYTTGAQTISGDKTFEAAEYRFEAGEYIFSGVNLTITGTGSFKVDSATETVGVVKNILGASGIHVLTQSEYNTLSETGANTVYIII